MTVKAKATIGNKETFFIGLNWYDVGRLKEKPVDNYILLTAAKYNLPFDILITYGVTDADILKLAKLGITGNTIIEME